MPVAVVLVPQESGVSQQEANSAILQLIEDRVHTLRQELSATARGVVGLADRLADVSKFSDAELAYELRNLDGSLERLLTIRSSLETRFTALSVQRRAITTPEADDPFADPILTSRVA